MADDVKLPEAEANRAPSALQLSDARSTMFKQMAASLTLSPVEPSVLVPETLAGESPFDSPPDGPLDEYGKVIHAAIAYLDHQAKEAELEAIEARQMHKSNTQMALRVIQERRDGRQYTAQHSFMIEVPHSVTLSELRNTVRTRCELKCKRFLLLWQEPAGATVNLDSQRILNHLIHLSWCVQPWVLHVRDEEKSESSDIAPIALGDEAKILFERYDVSRNDQIEKVELTRLMIRDLNLKRFINCSDLLVKRFMDGELKRLDLDGSKSLGFAEFSCYVSSMTRFVRVQLMKNTNRKIWFANRTSKAVEKSFGPALIPPPPLDGSSQGCMSIIDTGIFGVRLKVPEEALPSDASPLDPTLDIWRAALHNHTRRGDVDPVPANSAQVSSVARAKISVQSVAPSTVYHLAESAEAQRGEFMFSPVIRVDYPAFEDGQEPPGLGEPQAPPFRKPLTLVMPHCFDPKEGKESCVMLGAAHGALHWERIDEVPGGHTLEIEQGEMSVAIPYAGIFCAFTSTEAEDIAAVRFHLFVMPEVPRDDPSSLRVHLCPNLPDQEEEIQLAESSEWGVCVHAAATDVLYICQGARFKLQYLGKEQLLVWHGARVNTEFTIPVSGDEVRDLGVYYLP